MAQPTILYKKDGYVCFYLSNDKECNPCFLDEEDFQIVEYNNCWYFHKHITNKHLSIRRSIHSGWEGSFQKIKTETLQCFILKNFFNDDDLDELRIRYKNNNMLDNRKANLYLKDQNEIRKEYTRRWREKKNKAKSHQDSIIDS